MPKGDIVFGFVFLIAIFLVVNNWKGSNAILQTVFGGSAVLAKTLQGR